MYQGPKRLIRGMRGRVKRQVFLLTQLARGRLNRGYCTICDCGVWFNETGPWLRDQYLCSRCGSIPRNRALVKVLNDHFPGWRELQIHESSPGGHLRTRLSESVNIMSPVSSFLRYREVN